METLNNMLGRIITPTLACWFCFAALPRLRSIRSR
jgi:hypothetical protein